MIITWGDIFRFAGATRKCITEMGSWVSGIARKATVTHIQLTLTSPSAHVSPGNIITVRITGVARCRFIIAAI